MNANAKIVGKKLFLDGYRYLKSKFENGKQYWECQKLNTGHCRARAVITIINAEIVVIRGSEKSKHDHPPNQEKAKAEIFRLRLKRLAEEPHLKFFEQRWMDYLMVYLVNFR